ncbi:MAG: winged helix-turn-helix transcriptional regulator [Methanoregulaceae archaeon]
MTSSFRIASILAGTLALLLLAGTVAAATDYVVRPGYEKQPPPGAIPRTPEPVPVWELPIAVLALQIFLLPPEIFISLKMWAYLGFRRVSTTNVLDQAIRSRIYTYIRENPGIHLHGLREEMDLKMGTLRYHLRVLLLTHKITLAEDASSVRFYENNGTYSPDEQRVLKHLRNSTTREILEILVRHPDATRKEIAGELGLAGPSVTWHMKRLEDDQIITTRHAGRTIAYEIRPMVAGILAQRIGTAGIPAA